MCLEKIIKSSLSFLIEKYNMKYEYEANGKEIWVYFRNQRGSINYYSYEQFGEYELSLTINGHSKIILDSFKSFPEPLLHLTKEHNIFKLLFVDQRKKYWEKIATIFIEEIKKNNSLFGLKL